MDLVISTVSQGLLWALLAIGVYLTLPSRAASRSEPPRPPPC